MKVSEKALVLQNVTTEDETAVDQGLNLGRGYSL